MDWVHCNSCYVQPSDSHNFVLTSCGHIYCERCIASVPSSSCRICNAEHSTTALNGQLREEVREFFAADPIVIFNRYLKVLQFQKGHRDRYTTYLRRTQLKYEAAKKEIVKLHEEMKQTRRKIHAMQQELAWYKVQRERARARTASISSTPDRLDNVNVSPFFTPSDTQRSVLQQMQGSGMGNSRLTLGFSGNSASSNHGQLSPFSMPSTPIQHSRQSNNRYRDTRSFMSTPHSSVSGGQDSFLSPDVPSTSGGFNRSLAQQNGSRSPPSRGTPTDALKLLSLAYKDPTNPKP